MITEVPAGSTQRMELLVQTYERLEIPFPHLWDLSSDEDQHLFSRRRKSRKDQPILCVLFYETPDPWDKLGEVFLEYRDGSKASLDFFECVASLEQVVRKALDELEQD